MRTVPKQLPPFSLLVDDCGNNPRYIAKYLGVTERTVKKWIQRDHAPRAAMLALFFCTRWGREYVNCDAENHAIVMRGLANAAEHRAKQAEKKLLHYFEQGFLCGAFNGHGGQAKENPHEAGSKDQRHSLNRRSLSLRL